MFVDCYPISVLPSHLDKMYHLLGSYCPSLASQGPSHASPGLFTGPPSGTWDSSLASAKREFPVYTVGTMGQDSELSTTQKPN